MSFLSILLFYHIWSIIDRCVTVTFFLSVLFNKVIYLLDLLIPLQHLVMQLICPSDCITAKSRGEKRQEQSHKEQYASGSVDYVKTEGETRPVPQLYMDCKIKVSLNIQHAVQ